MVTAPCTAAPFDTFLIGYKAIQVSGEDGHCLTESENCGSHGGDDPAGRRNVSEQHSASIFVLSVGMGKKTIPSQQGK
jgi:hypothetical protein